MFIDYLNICASSRFKGGNISSYFYIKAIAEELRGLAVEFKLPIFTATQTTRSGYTSTDIGLEDTSESFGLPATADFMFALMTNEELDSLNQMKVKQLKNRYSDPAINRSFIIGVDRSKMRLYDVEQKAQNIVDANNRWRKKLKLIHTISFLTSKFKKYMPRKKAINKIKQKGTRHLEEGELLHYTKSMVKKRGKIYWRVTEKPTAQSLKTSSLKKTQEH